MTKRREASSGHYLRTCRDLHPKVTEIRYGRTYELHRIEDEVADIRSSRRLTYEHIERIRNSEVWNADVFGYWPPRAEVESILESTEWDFWNLPEKEPEKEEKAIESLLSVFRQIEPVSVILRFIVPKHYGILSPPVETVLGLGPFRSHPERYRAYLKNLREIRDVGQLDTAADVDMALWALQLGVLENRLPDEEHKCLKGCLKEEFKQDPKLQEIRARNLTGQPFSDISRVELAEALLESGVANNIQLAGQIAGIEFERLVRQLVGNTRNDTLGSLIHDERKLPKLVGGICKDESLARRFIADCKDAISTRNKAVHSNRPLKREEVARLMRVVRKLERMKERKE